MRTVFVVMLFVAGLASADVQICNDAPAFAGLSAMDTDQEIIAQCTIEADVDGTILVMASTGVNDINTWYTVTLTIGLDQPQGPGLVTSERVVDIAEGQLTRQNSFTTIAAPVVAGSHTLYYLAQRTAGTGTVNLYRPRITVIFLPNTSVNVRLCEGRHYGEWTTTTGVKQTVTSCSLNNTGLGSALVAADGSMRLSGTSAEAQFDIVAGAASPPESGSDRWLDAVPDLLHNGTDTNLADGFLQSYGQGSYTFSLRASRSSGSGTVSLNHAGITALWIATGGPVLTNSESLSAEYTSASTSLQTILETTVNPAQDGFFLIVATGSVGRDNANYEAHFMAKVDSGADIANRYIRIDGDVDRNLALTDLVPVTAGSHTIRLMGYHYDTVTGGRILVRDASLAVVFFPKPYVTVFDDDFETGWTFRWSTVVD